jgi:hypothetical protein
MRVFKFGVRLTGRAGVDKMVLLKRMILEKPLDVTNEKLERIVPLRFDVNTKDLISCQVVPDCRTASPAEKIKYSRLSQ